MSDGIEAKLGRVYPSSFRFNRNIPVSVAELLREIGIIANLVATFFDGNVDKVKLWFRLTNLMLGSSPRDLIRMGPFKRLLNIVLDAREENHPVPGK